MDTQTRIDRYRAEGRAELTARQRRRMIKKACRDPLAIIVRDEGMGFPLARQGEKLLVGFVRPQVQDVF